MRIEDIEVGTYIVHNCFYEEVYEKREGLIYSVDFNNQTCHFLSAHDNPKTNLVEGEHCWFDQSDIDEGFIEIYDKIKYPEYYL